MLSLLTAALSYSTADFAQYEVMTFWKSLGERGYSISMQQNHDRSDQSGVVDPLPSFCGRRRKGSGL